MPDDLESRRVRDIGACVGKTIAEVHHDGWSAVGLRFADGTYWYADTDGNLSETVSMDDDDFLNLGLIGREEHRHRAEERQRKVQERVEASEREQFGRLRAKFEGRASEVADHASE